LTQIIKASKFRYVVSILSTVAEAYSIESTEKSLIPLNAFIVVELTRMEMYVDRHTIPFSSYQRRGQEKYHTCGFPLGKKYRSHFEIIALIVEAVKESEQAKFSIMRHASINCGQLNKFLGALIEMGFIEQFAVNGRPIYRASAKGQSFLRQYYVLLSMLLTANKEVKHLPVIYEARIRPT